jgi:hypothetical protein
VDTVPGAPDALRALFTSLDEVPVWVDRDRVARAGPILFRSLGIGGIVLGARSLVSGYCSPAGNKPLVLTGRLGSPAQNQRLAETGRFVTAVCEPLGLERDRPGFSLCVRVRMMHAKVRWLIRRDPRWDREAWGEPINQHDLVATSLLFSQVFVDGLRRFGLSVTPQEAEDWLHLWRWASVLLGVDDSLLPVTEREAERLALLIRQTQDHPDDDSRRLVRAMLETAAPRPGGVALAEGFCRALLGDPLADELGLQRTPFRHAVRVVASVAGPVDRIRARSRLVDRVFVRMGERYWSEAVAASSEGRPLTYHPSEALRAP